MWHATQSIALLCIILEETKTANGVFTHTGTNLELFLYPATQAIACYLATHAPAMKVGGVPVMFIDVEPAAYKIITRM